MRTISSVPRTATASAALLATALVGPALAQALAIDADDIGGVVTSSNGPEAGGTSITITPEF